jgi:hypothetical protein
MHAHHLHPRQSLTALAALLAATFLAVLIPTQLADSDFGLAGSGSSAAPPAAAPAAPSNPPAWLGDPLAPVSP